MKNMHRVIIILAIALAGTSAARAQRPTPSPKPAPLSLAFQPTPGELHEVVMQWTETENDSQTNISFGAQLFSIPTAVGQTITVRKINSLWKVLDRDPKGNTVIEITYKYIRSARTFGRVVDAWADFLVKDRGFVVVWDTRRKTTEINPDFAGLEQMPRNEKVEFFIRYFRDIESVRLALANYLIDRPFKIVVDKQGRITEVQDMDLLLDQYRTELAKLTPDFQTRAKQDAIVNAFLGEDAVRQSLSVSQLLPFPLKPVAVGEKWSDSYEFTVLGRKVPVTREFSVVKGYPEYYELVGKTSYSIAPSENDKDLKLLGTAEISTTVDPQTGMFHELKQKGSLKRTPTAASNDNPWANQSDLLMRFDQTTSFSHVATRSIKDRSKWRYYGGYEDFYIQLGEHWYREPDESGPLFSGFINGQGGASITSAILVKGFEGAPQKSEDIPAYLESYSKVSLPVKTSNFKLLKTFRTANVEWFRAQHDVSYEAGFVEHLIVQGGFDGKSFFVFILRGWGDSFELKLAEGTAALDSIEIRTSR